MPDGIRTDGGHAQTEPDVTATEARLLRGVRLNLALWSGGITLAVLVVLGIVLYISVERSLSAAGIDQLENRARIETGGRPQPGEELPSGGFIFGGLGSGTFAMVADHDGRALTPGPVPHGLPNIDSIVAAESTNARDIRTSVISAAGPGEQATPIRVLTDPVQTRGGQTVYLQIVGDRSAEQQTLQVLVIVLIVGGVVALLVASGVGAAYASRALVPIRRSLVAQREALRRQREFAADASHELRTPLTVIRASVDDLDRHRAEPVANVGSALTDIRDEVDHLTAMVEDLLLLARSDSGAVAIERVPMDLGDVASDGASAMARPATDRGVAVTVDPAPAELLGDPARLRQLVMILVDNAIRHSPTGGTVRVEVRRDGAVARLRVDDEGPGLRDEDVAHVFDRFYRAPGAPGGGTGLGLSIAAWIVAQHGGRIGAANRESRGARFTVELPLVQTEPAARPAGT